MIYQYEQNLGEYFLKMLPSLKKVRYSNTKEIFLKGAPVIEYPSLSFYREGITYTNPLPFFSLESRENSVLGGKFYPVEVSYSGTIFVEKQFDALKMLRDFQFEYDKHPYVTCTFVGHRPISVGVRLLTIGIDSERDSLSEIGPERRVTFTWKSNLFLADVHEAPTYKGFILYLKSSNNDSSQIIKEFI